MTQNTSPADLPVLDRVLIVLEGIWQMAWPFLALATVILAGVTAYARIIRRMDARIRLDAERAAARSRVERRKRAQAANIEWLSQR